MIKIEWAALEDFCRYIKNPPLSSSTIEQRKRIFKRVSPYIEEYGWNEQTVQLYLLQKRKEGIKNKSVNQYIKFFRMLDEYLKTDHTKNIKPMIEEDTYFDVITNDELTRILAYTQPFSPKGRNRKGREVYTTLYLLLSEMALRIEEALSITWENWKGDYITIYSSKTDRYDDILITTKLQKALECLKREGELIFPLCQQGVNVELKKRCEYLKINKKISSHTFRRSFATIGIEAGIQEKFIQEKGRWKSADSMNKYVRKSKRHQKEVLQRHPFTIDSMTHEDKVAYITAKKRELEDEMRRLGVTI